MSIFDLFTERKSNSTNNRYHSKFNRNAVRSRNLRLESLEERALLSAVPLSASEYADLRAQYTEFDLPENMSEMNVIMLDLTKGDSLSTLKNAIATAGLTEQSDLIVVRTTYNNTNTLKYSSQTDELIININATLFGSVTIVGLGPKNLTLDANQQCRIMTVMGTSTIVNLGGLMITNGRSDLSTSNNSYGGGIYKSTGTLAITNCIISGNTSISSGSSGSSSGGGIYNNGRLIITDSTISENTAHSGSGGGIYNSGTLTITNSTISGNNIYTNRASYGGGISNTLSLTIINSTISDNSISNASTNSAVYGGGISCWGSNGYKVIILSSTISGNTISNSYDGVNVYGSGIYLSGHMSATITDSTISGNKSINKSSLSSYGGGIYYNSSQQLMIMNSTISGTQHL